MLQGLGRAPARTAHEVHGGTESRLGSLVSHFSVGCTASLPRLGANVFRMASFIGKMDTLRWTPHMDDCLKVLERDHEHPSDEVLVSFLKYQLVGEEAQKLLLRDVMGEGGQTPTYVFKKGLLSRLQEIRAGIPHGLLPSSKLPQVLVSVQALTVQIRSITIADAWVRGSSAFGRLVHAVHSYPATHPEHV